MSPDWHCAEATGQNHLLTLHCHLPRLQGLLSRLLIIKAESDGKATTWWMNTIFALLSLYGSQGCLFCKYSKTPACLVTSRSPHKAKTPLIDPDSVVQQGISGHRGFLLTLKNKCPWARQLTSSCLCGAALWDMEQESLHLHLLPQAVLKMTPHSVMAASSKWQFTWF